MRRMFYAMVFTAAGAQILGLAGCAYRMAAPLVTRSQQRLRIVADAPERYEVRVQSSDYHVPSDGRLMFKIQMVHRGCSVYLFDLIPLRKVADPAKEKIVSITLRGVPLRELSSRDLDKLQLDSEGYRQLFVSSGDAAPKNR